MPPKSPKRKPSGSTTALEATQIPITTVREPPKGPKLPTIAKFPLVVLISFSLTALANTVLVEFTGPKLYPVSRNLNEYWQAGLVVAWKILELGIGWFAGFDDIDMVDFTLLTHIPHAYLLRNFYLIELAPSLVFLATECVAWVPFRMLRRRRSHHSSTAIFPNSLTSDIPTGLLVMAVATSMYALPVVVSLVTWLPSHLAVTFDGLKTLDAAHSATLSLTLILLLPFGYCALDFLFTPAASTASTVPVIATADGEKTILEFDPETATLTQTLHRNIFWPMYLPARTQELLKRTTLLTLWTIANTWFLAFTEVEGAEVLGAAGWASVWGVGAASTGAMLGWVSGVVV